MLSFVSLFWKIHNLLISCHERLLFKYSTRYNRAHLLKGIRSVSWSNNEGGYSYPDAGFFPWLLHITTLTVKIDWTFQVFLKNEDKSNICYFLLGRAAENLQYIRMKPNLFQGTRKFLILFVWILNEQELEAFIVTEHCLSIPAEGSKETVFF